MKDKLWEYVRKNWDGWPLHVLIAVVLMHPKVSNNYPLIMLGLNIMFWPTREMWQHDDKLGIRVGFKGIWTLHRLIEWVAPIAAALLMWAFVV